MPDSLLNIGLKQIRKLVPVRNEVQLGDDFFIMDVKYSDDLQFLKYPCRSDAYIAIFCKAGGLNVEINLRSYSVTKGTLFVGIPGNIIKINRSTLENEDNYEFIVVAISKEYLSSISFDFKKIFDDRLKLLTEPCIQLDSRNIAFCTKYLDLMWEILSSEVPNKRESVGSLIASLFYILGGLMEKSAARTPERSGAAVNSRVKLIFEHFMALVTEHHTSERNMAFYASHLGLTPKYLSKLIKQVSGRSAPDWIDSFVILEAKNMLKYTDDSIKEIVFKLHFPNPSVFYKFFKAHTGMTPSEYRNG